LQQNEKTVGVIGGLGPQATADFFNRVIHNTQAGSDQDHLHVLIDNNPKIPNRNQAIAGTGPSPAMELAKSAQRLEQAGADFLVMPCNTAHAFQDAITEATEIPFVSIIDVTCSYIVDRFPDVKVAGLLAADGCRSAKLYDQAFLDLDITTFGLPAPKQQEFMQLVYLIKAAGVSTETRRAMQEMALLLLSQGAELIVGGCTEVPLALSQDNLPVPLIDTTEILARHCVSYARYESRE
jgi:aspartate racemase